MRLINVETMKLEEYFGKDIPSYAILSHTWHEQEVSFQHFVQSAPPSPSHVSTMNMRGYQKIQYACDQAERDGLRHVWIDTCCIDKTSSAELSEAINSMWTWYRNAEVCYVYLQDVEYKHSIPIDGPDVSPSDEAKQDYLASLQSCRWITRSWTLQELLAPVSVQFYSATWSHLGSKEDLGEILSQATGISGNFLIDPDRIHMASVSYRMSWAANRNATREEDIAYSLMGIFNVNMPLLYGEGSRAFIRLQEQIIQRSNDYSLFAWGHLMPAKQHLDTVMYQLDRSIFREEVDSTESFTSIFADSPHAYHSGALFLPDELESWEPFNLTNMGLQVNIPFIPYYTRSYTTQSIGYCILGCRGLNQPSKVLAIPVRQSGDRQYQRSSRTICLMSRTARIGHNSRFMYILAENPTPQQPPSQNLNHNWSFFIRGVAENFRIYVSTTHKWEGDCMISYDPSMEIEWKTSIFIKGLKIASKITYEVQLGYVNTEVVWASITTVGEPETYRLEISKGLETVSGRVGGDVGIILGPLQTIETGGKDLLVCHVEFVDPREYTRLAPFECVQELP